MLHVVTVGAMAGQAEGAEAFGTGGWSGAPAPVGVAGAVGSGLAHGPRPVLTRLQRILVTADGTLTRMLEAYAGEPIAVLKLHQFYDRVTDADAALDLANGAAVLRRRVLLCGEVSEERFLYAEAAVVPDRVDAEFLDGLLTTDKPIGALLVESGCESRRQILGVRIEPAGACGRHFALGPEAPVVARTYAVISGGQPIMLITERFPASSFRDLSE